MAEGWWITRVFSGCSTSDQLDSQSFPDLLYVFPSQNIFKQEYLPA